MGTEIERKFLVNEQLLPSLEKGHRIVQGYLSADKNVTVRVRRLDDQAYLTIKGKTEGISRLEFEYPIPLADALVLLEQLCLDPKIEKTRYKLPHESHLWELDVFSGANTGLILAEVELSDATQTPPLPEWVMEDVSSDPRYYNSNLMRNPFCHWQ